MTMAPLLMLPVVKINGVEILTLIIELKSLLGEGGLHPQSKSKHEKGVAST